MVEIVGKSVKNPGGKYASEEYLQVFVEATGENVLSASLNSLADGELRRRAFLVASADTFRALAEVRPCRHPAPPPPPHALPCPLCQTSARQARGGVELT